MNHKSASPVERKLVKVLAKQIDEIIDGDLRRAEVILRLDLPSRAVERLIDVVKDGEFADLDLELLACYAISEALGSEEEGIRN